MRIWTPFTAAMGFLTRLAAPKMYTEEEMVASVKYFPLVGLILGELLVLPFQIGLFAGHAWIQAWLLAGANLWATRGLHWDGWADIFDAWGSGATGEGFWDVLKDSRIGAFGAMALVMGLFGQILLLHEVFEAGAGQVVVLAWVLGRLMCVILAYGARNMPRSAGLGRMTLAGATPWAMLLGLFVLLLAAVPVQPHLALIPALMLGLLGAMELYLLARRIGALNGDFLGAVIVWGELATLMGWLLSARAMLPHFF